MKGLKINRKIVIVFILGIVLTGTGVYAVTTIAGNSIIYSNTKSGLKSTDVQGAIDELYEKVKKNCPDGYICAEPRELTHKNSNIVVAYTYSETGSNKCVTGEEATCQKTSCINYSNPDICPAGTIIKYNVGIQDPLFFHVMFDNGSELTMQSRDDIISNIEWTNYINGGPSIIMQNIGNITEDWENVNIQIAALGDYSYSHKGKYTNCDYKFKCNNNMYNIWNPAKQNARIITVQEAVALGCGANYNSCPSWVVSSNPIWTINSHFDIDGGNYSSVWTIETPRYLASRKYTDKYSARAVIDISK